MGPGEESLEKASSLGNALVYRYCTSYSTAETYGIIRGQGMSGQCMHAAADSQSRERRWGLGSRAGYGENGTPRGEGADRAASDQLRPPYMGSFGL
jgi:hypothetical protein